MSSFGEHKPCGQSSIPLCPPSASLALFKTCLSFAFESFLTPFSPKPSLSPDLPSAPNSVRSFYGSTPEVKRVSLGFFLSLVFLTQPLAARRQQFFSTSHRADDIIMDGLSTSPQLSGVRLRVCMGPPRFMITSPRVSRPLYLSATFLFEHCCQIRVLSSRVFFQVLSTLSPLFAALSLLSETAHRAPSGALSAPILSPIPEFYLFCPPFPSSSPSLCDSSRSPPWTAWFSSLLVFGCRLFAMGG